MNLDLKKMLAGVLVLAAAAMLLVKFSSKETPGAAAAPTSGPGPEKRQGPANGRTQAASPGQGTPAKPAVPGEVSVNDRAAAIEKMQEASTTYDPAELPVIRPYLVHPDPELRAAAVEAMIVLGDSSAGPMLRQAAKSLASEEEAKKMEQAADYIELPPAKLKDVKERMRRQREANDPSKSPANASPPGLER